MALGSTQPLKEMRPGIFPRGLRWRVHRADNQTTFMCQISGNLGASTSWNPQGLVHACSGIALPF